MAMTKKPRLPKGILERLQQVRDRAALQGANFGEAKIINSNGVPVSTDKFVKDKTRLYRETWVLPDLDYIIRWAKGEIN